MKTTGTTPDIEIIYEDNHLLAVNKPAGLLSQEDITGKPDLLNLCKGYLKDEYNKPGNVFLGLLHRLDKPVSGVMLFAKTSKAASRLSKQIRDRTIKKNYLAIVEGSPPAQQYLSHYLVKDRDRNISSIVHKNHGEGKLAELTFKKLESANGLHLLQISLITGRAHQIRVQLSSEGYPVWGDNKYGSSYPGNIALHSAGFIFIHPTLKKEIKLLANPPKVQPWNYFGKVIPE
ncbi:MAG: RluA family pseudouridine synthase [Balneolaceae bacterium]|nr:MAG: RluA family pseudouridine synthase [Balneolaceae bacterium]